MTALPFRGRRARTVENEHLRVTVLEGGGHIAEILDKRTGVNPLWTPIWPSVEPEDFRAGATDSPYGQNVDASLLATIMGHSLCLDLFGVPSEDEAAAGMPVHGECNLTRFELTEIQHGLRAEAHLTRTLLHFTRTIELAGPILNISERLENLLPLDRPIGWTQHATLGPPFVGKGVCELHMSAGRSKVFDAQFGTADYLVPGAEFDWPVAPSANGGFADLRDFGPEPSSCMTTSLATGLDGQTGFVVINPELDLSFGYRWRASDFPWMARWEENRSRNFAPWLGKSIALAVEFGTSPFPETRRAMIERGKMLGCRTYRWLPASGAIDVSYSVFVDRAGRTSP